MPYGRVTDEKILQEIFDKNPNIKRNKEDIENIMWRGATEDLRFLEIQGQKILQQKYRVIINYKRAVSYGSYEGHLTDTDVVWIDVPTVIVE